MLKIRTVKTSSGSTAIQVVEYHKRSRKIINHVGSAKNDEELLLLKQKATNWISDNNKQLSLFDNLPQANCNKEDKRDAFKKVINWNSYRSFSVKYSLLYKALIDVVTLFRFNQIDNNATDLLNDLAIARIVSPGSKLHSLKFLEKAFGIKHSYRDLSRILPNFIDLKDDIESMAIDIAKQHFNFNFSLVFYDLTTLYFESFETDELRKIGFSKDNKSSNPQIMIGLLVNDIGFPISYQLFPGNKFEGHTLMPSILTLRKKYQIKDMVIVADSAMIGDDNIKFLRSENLNYIVAARTANLSPKLITEISKQLNQEDAKTIRIKTENKGDLILSFSKKRYDKERREMDKQLEKANYYLKHPSAAEIIKRTKFLKGKKLGYELNQDLINKATLLLGIKGYYSNCTNLANEEIIAHYKELWHAEKAFRISKSDLKMRPIYHFKETSIKAHILICFMALAIAKFIEIKTKKSIRSFVQLLEEAVQTTIIDKITGEKITLEPDDNEEISKVLERLKN